MIRLRNVLLVLSDAQMTSKRGETEQIFCPRNDVQMGADIYITTVVLS